MINTLRESHIIKKVFFTTLIFVLMLTSSNPILAQPGDYIDSLITIKKVFNKNEKIEFIFKLEKQTKRKADNVRLVPTMSCACGDKDFYYELYSINNDKYPNSRKAHLLHNEKSDAKKCDCKSGNAKFYDTKKYSIPSIKQNGKYLLIIQGEGFIMYSNIFDIND